MTSWDPTWEKVFREQEWGKYPPEYVIRFVARNWFKSPDRRAIRVLDLGSGPGACTWFLAREGFSVSAIDGSQTAIRRLESRLQAENLEADARVGDCTELPWENESFDGVIDNLSICHNRLAARTKMVAEAFRVLKPAGRVLSASFTDRSWGYGVGRQVEPGAFDEVLEGPLKGKGLVQFQGRAQIEELFSPFAESTLETTSWTLDEMKHQIELWVATAVKSAK